MLNPSDFDQDTFSTCDGDCNDFNSVANLFDNDGDGFSTCDNDCMTITLLSDKRQ